MTKKKSTAFGSICNKSQPAFEFYILALTKLKEKPKPLKLKKKSQLLSNVCTQVQKPCL